MYLRWTCKNTYLATKICKPKLPLVSRVVSLTAHYFNMYTTVHCSKYENILDIDIDDLGISFLRYKNK